MVLCKESAIKTCNRVSEVDFLSGKQSNTLWQNDAALLVEKVPPCYTESVGVCNKHPAWRETHHT